MNGDAAAANEGSWTIFGLTANFACHRASLAVSTSVTMSHSTARVPISPLMGLTWSLDCALHEWYTPNASSVNPPGAGVVRAPGLNSADACIALSARVSAGPNGVPADVGVGAVPLPAVRAMAYASSSPALAASARLNAANAPGVVLGAAVADTDAKPGGSVIGNGLGPAVWSDTLAESSRATM